MTLGIGACSIRSGQLGMGARYGTMAHRIRRNDSALIVMAQIRQADPVARPGGLVRALVGMWVVCGESCRLPLAELLVSDTQRVAWVCVAGGCAHGRAAHFPAPVFVGGRDVMRSGSMVMIRRCKLVLAFFFLCCIFLPLGSCQKRIAPGTDVPHDQSIDRVQYLIPIAHLKVRVPDTWILRLALPAACIIYPFVFTLWYQPTVGGTWR